MISFQIIGIMACIFSISVLLLNLRTALEHQGKHLVLCRILAGICFILWVLSLPVSVIAYFLHLPFSNRLYKATEHSKTQELLMSYKDKTISALEMENDQLKSQVWDERFNQHDEQYKAGLRTGYRSGYREGYENCLSENGISNSPDITLHYISSSYSLSKKYVEEYESTVTGK